MNLIGPHQDIEFDLLNTGAKNVALFYEILPEELNEFRVRPEFGVIDFLVGFSVEGKVLDLPYVIVFRWGFELEAHELKDLVSAVGDGWVPSRERRIGEILGYPKEAVEYYIATFGASD